MRWKDFSWFHITSSGDGVREWLSEEFEFHELDIEDSIEGKALQPKRERHDDYNFLVLHFLGGKSLKRGQTRLTVLQLNAFITDSFLITIGRPGIPVVDNFFELLSNNRQQAEEWMSEGTGQLLHELIDRLSDQSFREIENLGKRIDIIDHDLFQLNRKSIEDISLTRRNIIVAATTIKPMIKIFARLEETEVDYLNRGLHEYWSSIKDRLLRMSELLADYSELLDGLTEAFDVLLTHGSNQIIKVLTIFSVIMLPLTFISGVYGMNVSLPFEGQWWAFYFILGLMLALSMSMIVFFKFKRWV